MFTVIAWHLFFQNELENLKLSSKATYERLTEFKDQELAEKMKEERQNWVDRIEKLSRESEVNILIYIIKFII